MMVRFVRVATVLFVFAADCSTAFELSVCPGNRTACVADDSCCQMSEPDIPRVPGGFGCMPPNSSKTVGCAGGGSSAEGCCCAPGPANISTELPNVLVIGDSVSAGYTPYLREGLRGLANVQHGPDNQGGGNADGSGYGQLCIDSFVRTPMHELPPWTVISFNFGLHDLGTQAEDYKVRLESIVGHLSSVSTATGATLLLFTTTMPGGSGEDPQEAAAAHVAELNAVAAQVAEDRSIKVVDLHATMAACGDACKACKPHCEGEGYKYLVDHAILDAIKAALPLYNSQMTV